MTLKYLQCSSLISTHWKVWILLGTNNQAHMSRVQTSFFIVLCQFHRNLPRLADLPGKDKADLALLCLHNESILIVHLTPPLSWMVLLQHVLCKRDTLVLKIHFDSLNCLCFQTRNTAGCVPVCVCVYEGRI